MAVFAELVTAVGVAAVDSVVGAVLVGSRMSASARPVAVAVALLAVVDFVAVAVAFAAVVAWPAGTAEALVVTFGQWDWRLLWEKVLRLWKRWVYSSAQETMETHQK